MHALDFMWKPIITQTLIYASLATQMVFMRRRLKTNGNPLWDEDATMTFLITKMNSSMTISLKHT